MKLYLEIKTKNKYAKYYLFALVILEPIIPKQTYDWLILKAINIKVVGAKNER